MGWDYCSDSRNYRSEWNDDGDEIVRNMDRSVCFLFCVLQQCTCYGVSANDCTPCTQRQRERQYLERTVPVCLLKDYDGDGTNQF